MCCVSFFFFNFPNSSSFCGRLPSIFQPCWMIINSALLYRIRSWQLWTLQKNRQLHPSALLFVCECECVCMCVLPDSTTVDRGEGKRKDRGCLDSDLWHPLLDPPSQTVRWYKTKQNLMISFLFFFLFFKLLLLIRQGLKFVTHSDWCTHMFGICKMSCEGLRRIKTIPYRIWPLINLLAYAKRD